MFKKGILLTLILGFVIISNSLYAQSEWQVKAEKSSVVIKEKKVACNDEANGIYKEMVMLQIENKSNTTVDVSFKKEMWFNNVCSNCDKNSPEHIVSVRIAANETTEATCNTNKNISIFSKMLNMKKSELTKFELKDLTVTTVK
jgi:hypothetical protein